MPTYSYACTACEHRFDTVQAFSDASLIECPECAGRLRKLFSSVGVVFKGSGFYRTDSRAPEKPEKESGAASETKSEAKKDGTKDGTSSTSSGTSSSSASAAAS